VVGQENKLGVPFRDGPETRWMRERDIERAYRERFGRAEQEQVKLAAETHELGQSVDRAIGAWLVGIARPRTPLPTIAGPPTRDEASAIFQAAFTRTAEILDATSLRPRVFPLHQLQAGSQNPRVGLRRWIADTIKSEDPTARSKYAQAELHHDGTVGFAIPLEARIPRVVPDVTQVATPIVESFCVDFLALVERYAFQLGSATRYGIRLDITGGISRLVALHYENWGPVLSKDLTVVEGSRSVDRFVPVLGEFVATGADEELLSSAKALAEDALHQFGVSDFML
jgi:hypothetical protein